MGGSLGKNYQQSKSKSQATNASQSAQQSFIDPSQNNLLQNLWSQASGVAGQQGGIGTAAQQLSQSLGQQGQSSLQALGGVNPLWQQVQQNLANFQPGGAGQIGAPVNDGSAMQNQIDLLGEDINRQLSRQIGGAGGLGSAFAQSGTFGGGRNQVAEGLANEGALNAFATSAGTLRAADAQQQNQQAMQQAIANQQAGLQAQGLAGQFAGAQQGLQQQGAMGQLGSLGNLFGLGMSPFGAAMQPWQQLSSILGDPTVLNQAFSQSFGQSTGSTNSFGTGFNFSPV